MRRLKLVFWGALAVLPVLWLVAEPTVLQSSTFFQWRSELVQLTGLVAFACMSLAMVLALRPRWPQAWVGGLDRMYRLHKWLGIAALVVAIVHWLWVKGPKWAVGWGWLHRPARGPRPPIDNPLEAWLSSQRGLAESLGEWAFYAAVVLIALALLKRFPYHWFYRTHRLIALAWLVLAFHAVVLLRFGYWSSPVGWVLVLLLAGGLYAVPVVLVRRVGRRRQVPGTITSLHYFAGVRALAIRTEVEGWPGHTPGQFAFLTSRRTEGAHPFTITSDWDPQRPTIAFLVKELGDYTSRLRQELVPGQPVRVEGPYGGFTFEDQLAHQIWIAGGIGITPFIGRMRQIAASASAGTHAAQRQHIHLFHSTADVDEEALAQLAADARSAQVDLHVLIDARDGRLSGERIRAAVPQWREASVWFCGPAGFGAAVRADLAAHGFPVERRFHQELFALR